MTLQTTQTMKRKFGKRRREPPEKERRLPAQILSEVGITEMPVWLVALGLMIFFVAINRGIDRNLGVQETRHGTLEAGQNRPITVSAVDNWGIGGATAQPEQVQQAPIKKVTTGVSGSSCVDSGMVKL